MNELAPTYASTRLTVDVYCLQHPDRYCVSAKSLAAHLTGLCWALDHPGDETGLRDLQRWLNGRVELTRPAIPIDRGAMTVANVAGAAGAVQYEHELGAWAQSTWAAYASLHDMARAWVRQATGP